MIELGSYNRLTILRHTRVGIYLGDDDVDDLLLPNKYVPQQAIVGEEIEVFCYLDHEERPIATTLTPHITRNHFGYLRVAQVNETGAFLDWGLEKHLLVPFREQRIPMVEGQWYVVYCYLDEKSFRLVASTRLDRFLDNAQIELKPNEKVSLLVSRSSQLGWDVIIDDKYKGLVYAGEVYKSIKVGDRLQGYIKKIREDGKIDVSLQPLGWKALEPNAQKIFEVLIEKGGYIPLHDKSEPEDIKNLLQMSKKAFKKGIGNLYREKKILIKEDGIYKT